MSDVNELNYTDDESWTAAIESVSVRRTADDVCPCGSNYSRHLYRTADGELLLRYDNAHEVENGHERHAIDQDEPAIIDFPDMMDLHDRFQRKIPGYVATYADGELPH